MTGGLIVVGDVGAEPVVLSDARSAWEADPVMKAFAATLEEEDWRAAVCVPLSWENRVFGMFGMYLPAGLAGPSEEELAFYTALADQAAVVVVNARLNSQARQAASSLERARLARELHDSVSQALFSMTMHARAAQLAMANAALDETGPLGRWIADPERLLDRLKLIATAAERGNDRRHPNHSPLTDVPPVRVATAGGWRAAARRSSTFLEVAADESLELDRALVGPRELLLR
jgi:GAF domain-containing protein